jgi:hypothetical protein
MLSRAAIRRAAVAAHGCCATLYETPSQCWRKSDVKSDEFGLKDDVKWLQRLFDEQEDVSAIELGVSESRQTLA